MYRPLSGGVPNSNPFNDVETTIRGLTQDFCTAFNTGNYDHVAAMFAPDAIFMPPHSEPSQGTKAIERVLREYGESGYQSLRLETTRVDYSGDMAVEVGRYTVVIERGNDATVGDHGIFMRAWRRLGAWLILAESWNSNLSVSDLRETAIGGGTKVA
jgi:uncharacterized protein (TIGR02246 family)